MSLCMSTEWLQFAALVQAVRGPVLGYISSKYREWRARISTPKETSYMKSRAKP